MTTLNELVKPCYGYKFKTRDDVLRFVANTLTHEFRKNHPLFRTDYWSHQRNKYIKLLYKTMLGEIHVTNIHVKTKMGKDKTREFDTCYYHYNDDGLIFGKEKSYSMSYGYMFSGIEFDGDCDIYELAENEYKKELKEFTKGNEIMEKNEDIVSSLKSISERIKSMDYDEKKVFKERIGYMNLGIKVE